MTRWADMTAEQKRKRAAVNNAWRRRNPDKVREYDKRYYDPDKQRAKNRRYYAANKAKRVAAAITWAKANPDRVNDQRRRSAWRRYGIDPMMAAAALAKHNGRCDCCGTDKTARGRWNVDHEHTTGRIRGILCCACNLGIGQLGDTVEGITNAVRYLTRR